MQRPWVKAAIAAAALLVVVVVLIPFLVHADNFRPALQDRLSIALGRKVTLGHLSLSLFSGSLVAQDIVIADDPVFSTTPFLQAKKLDIGVEIGPLLFHRQVRITKLTIDSPSIQLIQAQSGSWNFSSIGGAAASAAPRQQSTVPDLTVGELKIKDGSASVSSLPATTRSFVYSNINLSVQQLSFAKSFPFEISAKLPGGGTLKLSGDAGPLAQNDASDTPFHATIELKQFDPVASGVIDPGKGISMLVDSTAQLASDGTSLTSSGKVRAARLHLARTGSPAQQPIDIDYSVSANLATRLGQVSDVSVHTGSVAVHVKGSYQLTTQAVLLDLHLSAPNLPIDQLEQLLPAAGVTLPTGSSLRGGTLTATIAITGPATATTLAGPVEIDNTLLAGFDIGSKIQGLNPFGGSGGGTKIQTLRANVNSSVQSTQLSNIYADLPQVGTASGNGTVASSGALDFHLAAKFSPASGVGAVAGKAVNAVGGFLGKALHSKANNGIPLTITGTTSNPSIRANIGAML